MRTARSRPAATNASALAAAITALALAAWPNSGIAQDSGDAANPTPDTVFAVVNGSEITLGHMIAALASLPAQYQQLPADTLQDVLLEQLVQQEALRQSRQALSTSLKVRIENQERSLVAGEVIEEILAISPEESDIEAAFEERYASQGQGAETEYNASHILVEEESQAIEIVAELENGADFAELAKERSTGPSGPNGGSLGWFGPGMMVPEFQAAVEELEPGGVSGPVKTQFGWHVVTLNELREKPAPTLEDVREELVAELQNESLQARIEELVGAAEVDYRDLEGFDPEILRDVGLLDN